MKYDFNIRKGRDGWEARTYIPIGPATHKDGREGQRVLDIHTYKSTRNIVTRASVSLDVDGSHIHIIGLGAHGDFNKQVLSNKARATEQAIRVQHQDALANVQQIIAEAKAHYGMPEAEDDAALPN